MANVKGGRPFILKWRSAVLNSREDSSTKLAMLALAEFADKDGNEAIPGFKALAGLTSLSEKTCMRAFDKADGVWFTRQAVKLQGKDWRAYSYTLAIPEGADTVSVGSRDGTDTVSVAKAPSCGHSGVKVRTLTPEGADTVSTVLGRAPRKKHLGEKGNGSHLLTYVEWKEQRSEGQRLIPLEDPVFDFADRAGISDEFLLYAWRAFQLRYRESDDRCADWPGRFRRSIQEDWFKLWRFDNAANQYVLTNAGVQMKQWEEATDADDPS